MCVCVCVCFDMDIDVDIDIDIDIDMTLTLTLTFVIARPCQSARMSPAAKVPSPSTVNIWRNSVRNLGFADKTKGPLK